MTDDGQGQDDARRNPAVSHWECCNCGRTWDHAPEPVETLFCRSGNGACAETAVTWQSRALEAERRRHLDLERLDVVEAFTFNVVNAMKYLWRAGLKPGVDAQTDLRKAAWYVARELERMDGAGEGDG